MTQYLAKKAILVSLNISHWTARKLDKRVTDEVNVKHNAVADAGRYNKLILPRDAIKPIEQIVSAARAFHLSRTLPWRSEGARLLSVRVYEDYTKQMLKFESEFKQAVRVFVANYASYVAERKVDLNGLFNEADYPSAESVSGKFSFSVNPEPFADASDLRIELADAHAEQIKAEITRNVTAAAKVALSAPLQRVAEAVEHMVTRLTEYKPANGEAKASGVFRDSLVKNVEELADLLPALNLSDDPEWDRLAADLKSKLCTEDAETLRDNDHVRVAVAKDASEILARVESLLA